MSILSSKFWIAVLVVGVAILSFLLYALFSPSRGNAQAGDEGGNIQNGEMIIEISDKGYNPSAVVVGAETPVKWINKDTKNHSVSFGLASSLDNMSRLDQELASGESMSYKFDNHGTFKYFDRGSGFAGSIEIK